MFDTVLCCLELLKSVDHALSKVTNCRFAYIDFSNGDGLGSALELNGSDLGGYSLMVEEAKPRDGAGGGRGGGRSGGGRSGGRDSGGRFGGRRGGGRGGGGHFGGGGRFGGGGGGRGGRGMPNRPSLAGTGKYL